MPGETEGLELRSTAQGRAYLNESRTSKWGVGGGEGRVPGSLCWLPGVEGGLRVKTLTLSCPEGVDASRAQHQGLKDVGEGHHTQEVLGLIHEHQPVHLWVHRGSLRGQRHVATAANEVDTEN